MSKVDRFGMILIGFLIGAFLFSHAVVTEEVVVEKEVIKEVPVEVIVEKEVPIEVVVDKPSAELNKKYKEGTYKVGRDIPAGEYRAESLDENYNQIAISIGENPNFNNYDEYDITLYHNVALFVVEDGEYVQVSHADFYYLG